MKRKALVRLAMLICVSTPVVAIRASAQQGKPPAELNELRVFSGDWECAGQVFATADHPAHATTGHVRAGKVLDGYWVQLSYDENKTAVPIPLTSPNTSATTPLPGNSFSSPWTTTRGAATSPKGAVPVGLATPSHSTRRPK